MTLPEFPKIPSPFPRRGYGVHQYVQAVEGWRSKMQKQFRERKHKKPCGSNCEYCELIEEILRALGAEK